MRGSALFIGPRPRDQSDAGGTVAGCCDALHIVLLQLICACLHTVADLEREGGAGLDQEAALSALQAHRDAGLVITMSQLIADRWC